MDPNWLAGRYSRSANHASVEKIMTPTGRWLLRAEAVILLTGAEVLAEVEWRDLWWLRGEGVGS
jgi:hypothetical protein